MLRITQRKYELVNIHFKAKLIAGLDKIVLRENLCLRQYVVILQKPTGRINVHVHKILCMCIIVSLHKLRYMCMCPFPFFVTMLIPYLCQTIKKKQHDTPFAQCATFIERGKEGRQTNRERERERERERIYTHCTIAYK